TSRPSLPPRAFLRRLGATIALPFLDAMVPALGAGAAAIPAARFGVVYIANGAIMERWIPEKVGTGFEFTPILKPLEPYGDAMTVVTNLTRSHPGSQVGDHAVSAAGFLTGGGGSGGGWAGRGARPRGPRAGATTAACSIRSAKRRAGCSAASAPAIARGCASTSTTCVKSSGAFSRPKRTPAPT